MHAVEDLLPRRLHDLAREKVLVQDHKHLAVGVSFNSASTSSCGLFLREMTGHADFRGRGLAGGRCRMAARGEARTAHPGG